MLKSLLISSYRVIGKKMLQFLVSLTNYIVQIVHIWGTRNTRMKRAAMGVLKLPEPGKLPLNSLNQYTYPATSICNLSDVERTRTENVCSLESEKINVFACIV